MQPICAEQSYSADPGNRKGRPNWAAFMLLTLGYLVNKLPGVIPVAGVGAGAVSRIPADGGGQVLDAVIVRRRIERSSAVS